MRPKSKITRAQILIIAGVLSLIIAGGVYFGLLRPLNERMEAANAKYTTNEPIAAQRSAAQADKKAAQAEVQKAKMEYARYEKRFFYRQTKAGPMPLVDVSNRLRALQQRWQLQGQSGLGPEVVAFLRNDKSVRITQAGLSIPAPPQDANEAAENLIVLPLGSVAVEGTFDKVLDHTVRWNGFNRLMLVDGLALQGNSPRLAGTYALTCYIYASGDKPGAEIPSAGAAGGGGGGFGGGYPGSGGGSPGGSGYGAAGPYGGGSGGPRPAGAGRAQ